MKKNKGIMFQGTASNVGKSIVATGICRILYEEGYDVIPFKPQNMSLNSTIDEDGREMGIAQAIQADACGKKAKAYMNPVLLKPCGNHISQVIVNGRVIANMKSEDYRYFKEELIPVLEEIYSTVEKEHDVVVIEGAGSPVELNINQVDISNMEMARIADCPVILIADIDKGGVFASVYGTLALMNKNDRKRVKGIIINKFRGKKEYFKSGIQIIENLTGLPVIGVIPYMDIMIEEEDGVSEKFTQKEKTSKECIRIDILRLPHMSNYTDFQIFEHIDSVKTRYISQCDMIDKDTDVLIIPGSKNTIEDMKWIRDNGFEDRIRKYETLKKPLIGICGGYQILGESIDDMTGSDGYSKEKIKGLEIIPVRTVFADKKTTKQVSWLFGREDGYFKGLENYVIEGYEIHYGKSIEKINKDDAFYYVKNGHILGTYSHAIFDNTDFTIGFVNNVRKKKGLDTIEKISSIDDIRNREYSRLSKVLRENLDIKLLMEIIFKDQ